MLRRIIKEEYVYRSLVIKIPIPLHNELKAHCAIKELSMQKFVSGLIANEFKQMRRQKNDGYST